MNDYINEKWVGGNCTNPEALFESIIIAKPEDLISTIIYRYFDGNRTILHQVKSSHMLTLLIKEDASHFLLQQK